MNKQLLMKIPIQSTSNPLRRANFLESMVTSMLTTFSSIQSRQNYTGGQFMEAAWHYENWTVPDHLGRCTVQSAETGGQV